jgi:hypothetical protein
MFLGFGPQALVGGSHLPRHTTGHLSRQAKLSAHLRIRLFLETLAIAGPAMGKRVRTDIVQGISVGQLGQPQSRKLLRGRQQFQFGSNAVLHAERVSRFCVQNQAEGGRSFLPLLKRVGIRRALL